MSKRAEAAAMEAYPDYRSMDGGYITQRKLRHCYVKGFERAEKETIERAARWIMEFENQLKVRFRITDTEFLEQFRKEMEEE